MRSLVWVEQAELPSDEHIKTNLYNFHGEYLQYIKIFLPDYLGIMLKIKRNVCKEEEEGCLGFVFLEFSQNSNQH